VLSEHQSEICDDFDRLVARHVGSVLFAASTGSGKTITASTLTLAVAAWQAEAGVYCGGLLFLRAPR
jgi:superfamily II DNA or RNA helicase